ncbi:MAG: hypothetical protein M0O94_03225 [Bacteroidales bacterium]|nr:hypothetical protein [Bacteroidales bacterium]HPE87230.1 hypothetical protein [Bacteroidales bacterium]
MLKNDIKAMVDPVQWYQQKLNDATEKKIFFDQRRKVVSWLRVGVFLGGLIAFFSCTNKNQPTAVAAVALATIIIFLALLKWFTGLKNKGAFYSRQVINLQNELSGLQGDLRCFDGGTEFQPASHAYADDIDLFGESSLFQLINRTGTAGGKEKLAAWLLNPEISSKTLLRRQHAVEELRDQTEFRLVLKTYSDLAAMSESDVHQLVAWSKLPPVFSKRLISFFPVLATLFSVTGIILVAAGVLPFSFFLLYVIVGPLFINALFLKQINERHTYISHSNDILGKYAAVFQLCANTSFTDEYLTHLQQHLLNEAKANVALKKLSNIMGALDSRMNILAAFLLNGLFLWDLWQMVRLERWQSQYAAYIPVWFDSVATFDVLSSLAGFAFRHPAYTFPEFTVKTPVLVMKNAGHPLLPKKERVGNDFYIKTPGSFVIITGANMAGKSTFLRTVAVNMVLAMTGTVVCSSRMQCKPMQLITGLRTTDNLLRSESYFFAELKRLKWIIDRLNRGEELFILLDEILKGTNSRDKQAGSMALIRQFIRLKTTGIIATHDILLGSLAESYPAQVENRCFEVVLQEDRLKFDYKLREGISQNMNATFLMRRMGITME